MSPFTLRFTLPLRPRTAWPIVTYVENFLRFDASTLRLPRITSPVVRLHSTNRKLGPPRFPTTMWIWNPDLVHTILMYTSIVGSNGTTWLGTNDVRSWRIVYNDTHEHNLRRNKESYGSSTALENGYNVPTVNELMIGISCVQWSTQGAKEEGRACQMWSVMDALTTSTTLSHICNLG